MTGMVYFSSDHPYRQQTLYHLAVLQVNLKIRQNQSQDLQEVMMSLSPAYEKWEQETLAKGRQEGQLEIVRRMLQGDLPLETIAQVTGWSIEQLQRLQADQPQKVFEK
jgi:predicted transposase/invertase (TIGR01784 family)